MLLQKILLNRASQFTFIFIISITSFQSLQAAPPENYSFLPLTKALQQSKSSQKPIFLYFGRYGCSTCLKMHKEVFSASSVQKKYSDNFILAYVDTESGKRIKLANGERTTEMQFAARNRILGTPTFIYFSPEQKPLFKRSGFQTIEQMNQYSDYIAKGFYKNHLLKDYLVNLSI